MICRSCNSHKVVDVQGEYTCTACGLVLENVLVDDTCILFGERTGTKFQDLYSRHETKQLRKIERYQLSYKERKTNSQEHHLKSMLGNKMLLDDYFINTVYAWFIKLPEFKNQPRRDKIKPNCVIVCCCYCVSMYLKRGIDIRAFCEIFEVDTRTAWRALEYVMNEWKNERFYSDLQHAMSSDIERLKRIVYVVDFIEQKDYVKVIKVARDILDKVANYPKLSSAKRYNMISSCLFIACMINNVKVKKETFCKTVCVSIPTINVLEETIQQALMFYSQLQKINQ